MGVGLGERRESDSAGGGVARAGEGERGRTAGWRGGGEKGKMRGLGLSQKGKSMWCRFRERTETVPRTKTDTVR